MKVTENIFMVCGSRGANQCHLGSHRTVKPIIKESKRRAADHPACVVPSCVVIIDYDRKEGFEIAPIIRSIGFEVFHGTSHTGGYVVGAILLSGCNLNDEEMQGRLATARRRAPQSPFCVVRHASAWRHVDPFGFDMLSDAVERMRCAGLAFLVSVES